MSSQELERTQTEAESWELNLLISQGTSPGNMQTLTLLQTNLSMQSQGTSSCWNGGGHQYINVTRGGYNCFGY